MAASIDRRRALAKCSTNGSTSMLAGFTGSTITSCPCDRLSHFKSGLLNIRYCFAGRMSVITPG